MALKFSVIAECAVSKARASRMELPHSIVDTPVFMPVGTQGTMKGVTPDQLISPTMDCRILLSNTYHLANRPGTGILTQTNGLHDFMKWNRSILTDSGGYQMVSLLDFAEITEEGVKFKAPHDGSEMLLTPEESINIQNVIGADIIMQLDDVVHSLTTRPRVEMAMWRTLRWLDRCIKAHKKPNKQSLFGIVQGGLEEDLRKICCKEMLKRDLPGYAIGGLSGGEKKDIFWKMVSICTDCLPTNKPRYCMGVGVPVDLVVCCALGVDMFDCVYPTRTARFGTALVPWGQVQLKLKEFANDFRPIDQDCPCITCTNYTRAALHSIVAKEPVSCNLVTIHNLTYHLSLMKSIRTSILKSEFPAFVKHFMESLYPDKQYEQWAVDALNSVGIQLTQ